jgi:hypothetical protein
MQELILIISRCSSKKQKQEDGYGYYSFHFKGYYAGEKIKRVHLYTVASKISAEKFNKGDDYFLWVKRKRVNQEVLEVELIKYKLIL